MGAWGTTIMVLVALGLAVAAVVQLRSGPWPFPALVTGAITCAVCYVAAGLVYLERPDPSADAGPAIPTVVGSLVGLMTLTAMVMSLVPRSPEKDRDRRSPIMVAAAGTLLGAGGLIVHALG